MFRLKPGIPSFTVVHGQFAGRRYEKDGLYEDKDVPPQEKDKFIPADEQPKKAARAARTGGSK